MLYWPLSSFVTDPAAQPLPVLGRLFIPSRFYIPSMTQKWEATFGPMSAQFCGWSFSPGSLPSLLLGDQEDQEYEAGAWVPSGSIGSFDSMDFMDRMFSKLATFEHYCILASLVGYLLEKWWGLTLLKCWFQFLLRGRFQPRGFN